MKSRYMNRILGVCCIMLISTAVLAQESCTQVLADANLAYQNGLLSFVNQDDFKNCYNAEGGFTKPEKIQARRLETLVHIYEDRIPAAESSMIQLLHDDPEHPIDTLLDPHEFVYLYEKFRTKPIFRVGVRIGATYSTMNLIDEFGIENTSSMGGDTTSGSFSPQLSFGGSVYIDYNFWNNFEASLGVGFAQRVVTFDNDLYSEEDLDAGGTTTSFSVFGATNYTDTYSFIDVPFFIKYNFDISPKLVIFPYAGAIGHYLVSASRSGSRGVVTPPDVDLTSQGDNNISSRSTLNYSLSAGVGVKYRVNTDYFTLELGVNRGANNFVDPDGRYQSNDLVFRLGQVDGNMGLDYLTAMIGYQRSIYSPKKLKQYRDK